MDILTKLIGDKKRWRAYKARVRALPEPYRAAVEAVERYCMYFAPTDGDAAAQMFEDLADLFEQAAADGTPVRGVVGDDPAEFVDTFVRNYTHGAGWASRERQRLTSAIERAAGETTDDGSAS